LSVRTIQAQGLTIRPSSGWEATIYQRPAAVGERTYPIVHASTVPIPVNRGDYGGGLVELLGPQDVFVSFLEFGPEAVGTPLFSSLSAVPGLTPDAYRPRQLQRTIVLYSVIGSFSNRIPLTDRANQLIGTFSVEPA
jgi:hypothetical protein